jgi:phosphoglycerate dehydrogenase-like enzyme
VRHVVPRQFLERGGVVTNWGTLAAQAVAEQALLLILAGLRRLPEWPPVIAGRHRWHPSPIFTRTLYGKRLGIHGFGNVAHALVSLCRPFGVSVSAFTTGVPAEVYKRQNVTLCNSLEDLFENSDILVECEALTPLTRALVTRRLLRKLPQGALFVNVGRGAVVDEKALADLAQSGHLHLALDVFANDPIAPDSPLHAVEGAVLSPHIAGPTSDQFARCGDLVKKNLRAFFGGLPLDAVVTLEMYDRAT